jgi:hypothetical protein
MPRPPHDRQDPTRDYAPDDDAGWPSSVTDLQRQHARAAGQEPDDDALSTARLRARKKRPSRAAQEITRRVAPTQVPPGYEEPLDVRAGEAIVGGVRRAGGRTLDYLRGLRGQRLWTMVAVALAGGAIVGGIAAFGMRKALSERPDPPWAGARAPAVDPAARDLAEPAAPRAAAEPREPAEPRAPARPRAAAEPREPAEPGEAPAPRAAAAPRAPAEPVPIGRTLAARSPATLVIVSEPFGAEISVNGQSTGLKTPDSVEGLVPGRTYKVTLTRKGYLPWEEEIEIASGGPKHVSARLEKGKGRGAATPGRRRR